MEKKQNVPALRFREFCGDWGKYNLNMLSGLITKGTTPLDKSGKGNVNFVKIENIDANTGKIHITQKISQKEHNGYLKRSQLKENDILFSIAGTLGRVAVVNTNILPANTNQALAIIRLKKGHFKYIKTYLQGKAVANFLKANPTVGAQPNLSLAQVGSLEIIMPEKSEEQGNIADFFQYLDELIFRTVSKIQKIQQFRQAMLMKLFPREGAEEPELCFRGFSGKWTKRKLKEISLKSSKRNTDRQYTETFTNSAEFGVISQRDFFDHDISNAENTGNYYIVENDDFVYNPRISTTAPVGPINRNRLGRTGIMSPLYMVFKTHDVDCTYLEWFFKTTGWHSFMRLNGDTGARADRFSIKENSFFEMPISCPSLEEQKQIGKFFDQLDSFISLQKKKLERMQRLKAALLEKMFV